MQTLTRSTVIAARQEQPTVMAMGYFYAVDLDGQVRPQHHRVGINGECACPLGKQCPAVSAVRSYLADGGKRAERPPYGFYPVHPAKCPIPGCGAPAYFERSLSSTARGAGWSCAVGGRSHYWQHRAHISAMRRRLAVRGKLIQEVWNV